HRARLQERVVEHGVEHRVEDAQLSGSGKPPTHEQEARGRERLTAYQRLQVVAADHHLVACDTAHRRRPVRRHALHPVGRSTRDAHQLTTSPAATGSSSRSHRQADMSISGCRPAIIWLSSLPVIGPAALPKMCPAATYNPGRTSSTIGTWSDVNGSTPAHM